MAGVEKHSKTIWEHVGIMGGGHSIKKTSKKGSKKRKWGGVGGQVGSGSWGWISGGCKTFKSICLDV